MPQDCPDAIDAEVELAIVIGMDCKDVKAADAMRHVLGYTLANDVTARDVQGRVSQWSYSKGFDTFCPMGPTLVSQNMITDPHQLRLKTVINGKTLQDGTTKELIFSIPEIIEYVSRVGRFKIMYYMPYELELTCVKGYHSASRYRYLNRNARWNRSKP